MTPTANHSEETVWLWGLDHCDDRRKGGISAEQVTNEVSGQPIRCMLARSPGESTTGDEEQR